jgi:hypothetical protein
LLEAETSRDVVPDAKNVVAFGEFLRVKIAKSGERAG